MKKVVIRVWLILLLLIAFNVPTCQAEDGSATYFKTKTLTIDEVEVPSFQTQPDSAVIGTARVTISDDGQVDVDGNISTGPGQQVTAVVIGPGGGIAYTNSVLSNANGDFTFSFPLTDRTPGTFTLRLGGSGVDRPVTVTFYSPMALSGVSVSLDGNEWVVVTGRITSGAGRQVTINVTDPNGQPDYVDSTLSQSGGRFMFSYPLNSRITGTYHVKIGAEGISNPVTLSFPYGCKSDDATLSSLKLSAGSLDQAFAPETTRYTATVPVEENSVAVIPVPSDVNASIKVNDEGVASGSRSKGMDLALGADNTISIVVTAQDGVTTKTYTVNISRGYDLSDVSARINQEKRVSVRGRISAGAGQVISVVITDPNGHNDYVNSTLSTAGGEFSFSYPMSNDTEGKYTVKVGGNSVAEPETTSFTYMPVIKRDGGGGGGAFVPISAVAVSNEEIVLTFSKEMIEPEDSAVYEAFVATCEGEEVIMTIAGGDSHVNGDDPHEISLLFPDGNLSGEDIIILQYTGDPADPITAQDLTPVADFIMDVTNEIPID